MSEVRPSLERMQSRTMIAMRGRPAYAGKSASSTPFRNWHKLYTPCSNHATIPDLVAVITSAAYLADSLEFEDATDPNGGALARELRSRYGGRGTSRDYAGALLNDVVTDCDECRDATRKALVEYGRKLRKNISC